MKVKKKYIQLGFLIVVTFIVSYLIATGLKSFFKTPRPCIGLPRCPSGYSFPSRHVTVAFAIAMAVYLETKKKNYGLVLFFAASVIAVERIITFVHTPSDVVGGLFLGCLIGWSMQRLYVIARFLYEK